MQTGHCVNIDTTQYWYALIFTKNEKMEQTHFVHCVPFFKLKMKLMNNKSHEFLPNF